MHGSADFHREPYGLVLAAENPCSTFEIGHKKTTTKKNPPPAEQCLRRSLPSLHLGREVGNIGSVSAAEALFTAAPSASVNARSSLSHTPQCLSSVSLHMFGFSVRQRISLSLKDELSAGNSPSVWLQLRASLDLRCLSCGKI